MGDEIEQLCGFCWEGNVEKAKSLIDELPVEKINTGNSRGQSPLYCAARSGKEDIIVLLAGKKGVDLNIKVPSHGGTPLHASGFSGHGVCTALLLMIGADPTVANNSAISARDEAKADAIDIYFVYDYEGINGLIEKYPQYAKIAVKKKRIKSQGLKGTGSSSNIHANKVEKDKEKDKEKKKSQGIVSIRLESDGDLKKTSSGGASRRKSGSDTGKRKSVDLSRDKKLSLERPLSTEDLSEGKDKKSSDDSRRRGGAKKKLSKMDLSVDRSRTDTSESMSHRDEVSISCFLTMGNTKPLTSIQELLDFENIKLKQRNQPPQLIPSIIERSISCLLLNGLSSEGLFRVPGCKTTMDELEAKCNAGDSIELDLITTEPADIASFLKKYLRDVPDRPLFTSALENEFAGIGDNDTQSLSERVEQFHISYKKLPILNQLIVEKLLFLLSQVVRNEYANRMTLDAVSIVFGQMSGILCTQSSSRIVNWCIEHYHNLFEDYMKKKEPVLPLCSFVNVFNITSFIDLGDEICIVVAQNGNVKLIDKKKYSIKEISNLFLSSEREIVVQSVTLCNDNLYFLLLISQISHLKVISLESLKSKLVEEHVSMIANMSSSSSVAINGTPIGTISFETDKRSLLVSKNRIFIGNNEFSEIVLNKDLLTISKDNVKELIPPTERGYFVLIDEDNAYRYSSDGHHHIEEWSMVEGKKNSFVDIEYELISVALVDNHMWLVNFNDIEYLVNIYDTKEKKLIKDFQLQSISIFIITQIEIFPTEDYIWIDCSDGIVIVEKMTKLRLLLPPLSVQQNKLLSVKEVLNGFNIWVSNEEDVVTLYFISLPYIESLFKSFISQRLSTPLNTLKSIFDTTHSSLFSLSRYNKPLAIELMPPFMKSLVMYRKSRNKEVSNNTNCSSTVCSLCTSTLYWPVQLNCGCRTHFCYSCIFNYEGTSCPHCTNAFTTSLS